MSNPLCSVVVQVYFFDFYPPEMGISVFYLLLRLLNIVAVVRHSAHAIFPLFLPKKNKTESMLFNKSNRLKREKAHQY